MTDSSETAAVPDAGDTAQPFAPAPAPGAAYAPASQESAAAGAAEHPELLVGAAFAGGLMAALILKRLAS